MTTNGAGACKIRGVSMGDVTIDGLSPMGPVLSARYAYVLEDGTRVGSGNRNQGWSPETLVYLQTLLASLERDVCQELFEDGATTNDGGASSFENTESGIDSL